MVAPLIARIVRIASAVTCLIAVGWFVGFAVEQSKQASAHQQAELNGTGTQPQPSGASGTGASPSKTGSAASAKKSGLREAVDKAFSTISSPFSGLTSGLSSAWTLHIVDTLLALLIYGFGLGYLARLLRLGSL
jgi:uncharacterized membrane protein YraQ (UPF0718 family)